MKKERLDALADGIFAIVITLLVIEIKVPELSGIVTDGELWHALQEMYPLFLSYLLSFALLFTYWRAHNYLMSVFAKNIDTTLSNMNAIFFFFVALIPFSSHLLGLYSDTQIGVAVIGVNTMLIGISLLVMRRYIIKATTIENVTFTPKNMRHGTIRTIVPIVCASMAMILSFVDIQLALLIFTLAVIFNLLPYITDLIDMIFFRNALKVDADNS